MDMIIAVMVVAGLLLGNEWYWRRTKAPSELARKFIHITVGSFVAFWPFFLEWNEIRLLSIAFLLAVIVSKYLHIFQAIHSVQRPTWGEMFFAAAVGLTTLITDNPWVYMTALLQMSLADGLAAIIGTHYGREHRYSIIGQHKSLHGTAAFAIVSLLTIFLFSFGNNVYIAPLAIAGIAAGATLLENIGTHGLDNLLVPLFVASMLNLIA